VVRIGELVMIMELHRQGLSPSAIARQLGIDRRRFANTSPLASSRPATVRDRLGLKAPMPSCRICASGWPPIPG
jgi:transposase